MKKDSFCKIIIGMLLAVTVGATAQQRRMDKLSPMLRHIVRHEMTAARGRTVKADRQPGEVCALVKATDAQSLADHGCRVIDRVGDIFVASVPVGRLSQMADDHRILRVEARQGVQAQTDSLAMFVNALPVYEGQNLPQAFTGKGVMVGVMDIGFDLTSPNFYSRDTTQYRIQALWDMLSVDTIGSQQYVGRDYVGRDALLALGHSRDGADHTHGTHTLGVAVGSGYQSPYRGMAPEADICLVANATSDNGSLVSLEDRYKFTFATDALGFKYLFDCAKKRNQPCVVSFSEGSGQDFRGYDVLYYEMLDSLIGPGRIMVSAAGNRGHLKEWFRKAPGEPSKGTFLQGESASSVISTFKSASPFQIRVVCYGETNDTIWIDTRDVPSQSDSLLTIDAASLTVDVEAYPSCYDDREMCYDVTCYAMEKKLGITRPVSVEIVGTDADVEFWRVTGTLTDHPLNPALNAGECVRNILSPSSSPRVICVGATSYRDGVFNMNGEWKYYWFGLNGVRVPFSSVGPTMDGRVKPDVMAPGNNVVSSYSSFYMEKHPTANDLTWDVERYDFKGRTYAWISNSGTSVSCPAVAGAIALWLQAKPDLTTEEVLDVFAHTCTHYDQSLSYPNNEYGYGQIDVYGGLLYLLGIDKIESVSTSHTPARVTIQDGSLAIRLSEPSAAAFTLRIYGLNGRLCHRATLPAGHTSYNIPLPALSAGIYAVQLSGSPLVQGSTLVRLP